MKKLSQNGRKESQSLDGLIINMKTYLRKSWSKEEQKEMVNAFLDGMSLTDISNKWKIYYLDLRYILATEFGTYQLLRHRKMYWEKKGKPAPNNKSKSIAITCDLLMSKDLTYSDIGKKHNVSRERVGQIAEVVASLGFQVTRSEKQKRGNI